MREDFFIEQKYGRCRPFNVPEGYFDKFEKSFMENLPEYKKQRPIIRFLIPATWVACVIFIVLGSSIYINNTYNKGKDVVDMVSVPSFGDYTIDEIFDYAMLDNEDFYYYLSAAD